MPRRPRIKQAGLPQHLMQRGVNPSDGPAKLMQSVGRRYVQYVNRFYRRSGTLWEGRFKSSAIQTEEYLLLCQRYIELNPVRPGMVAEPAHYRWSSYRDNGLGQADRRLTPHPVYEALGRDEVARWEACRALFRSELEEGGDRGYSSGVTPGPAARQRKV